MAPSLDTANALLAGDAFGSAVRPGQNTADDAHHFCVLGAAASRGLLEMTFGASWQTPFTRLYGQTSTNYRCGGRVCACGAALTRAAACVAPPGGGGPRLTRTPVA